MSATAKKLPPPQQPGLQRLKKGELIFKEGESSRSMYLIQRGVLRLFKKKGSSDIELATAQAGQIVGELAFLDGNPRSASGEALTDIDLVEISGETFQHTLTSMPEWVKILLKTVVGRLRGASNRIRELEQSSVNYVTTTTGGTKSMTTEYVFLSIPDLMKNLSIFLLVGSRYSKKFQDGSCIFKMATLTKYATYMNGVATSKLMSVIDLLSDLKLLEKTEEAGEEIVRLPNISAIDETLSLVLEEHMLDSSKKHNLSEIGHRIISAIGKHLGTAEDLGENKLKLNISLISKAETASNAKGAFSVEQAQELVYVGYLPSIQTTDKDNSFITVDKTEFVSALKMQRMMKAVSDLNRQKREAATQQANPKTAKR